MIFKLTRNDIIALELRKNMDIDNALRLDFGPELILLCTRKFEKKTMKLFQRTVKHPWIQPISSMRCQFASPIKMR